MKLFQHRKPPKILVIGIITAVIALPLAYSLFYLGAFWDPYGRLDTLPVAVVNEDAGAVIDGVDRNVGSEMVRELQDKNDLKWVVTDAAAADRGVNGNGYYAVITIPEGFSSAIASADTSDKQASQITYTANEKNNYLAAQILNRAVLELEETLRSKVDKEITATLVDKLNGAPEQLRDLSNGLGDLKTGTLDMSTGLNRLADGQKGLQTGLTGLDNGLSGLLEGSEKLGRNLQELHGGITQTKAGVDSAIASLTGSAAQTTSMSDGIERLAAGAQQLSAGAAQAADGAKQLSAAASSKTSGLPALAAGISQNDSGAQQLAGGVNSYVDGVNTMIDHNGKLASQLGAICASTDMTDAQKVAAVSQALAAASSPENQQGIQKLSASGAALKSGAASLSAGAGKLQTAAASAAALQTNLTDLSDSLAKLSNGASEVAKGVGTLREEAAGISKLSDSMSSLSAALTQLDTGSQKLYDGSRELTSGLASAKEGSSRLVDGGAQLQTGVAEAQDGAVQLSDGIGQAKSGVDTSVTTAETDLKATDGLADYAEAPVKVVTSPINSVPNYGTAFSPYFVSLSLYVGALIMFVGIYLDNDEKIKTLSRNSAHRLARVGGYALIGVAQAVALALLVQFGLGLRIAHPAAFYLSCILASAVFIAIVEFFFLCLKDFGKFLAMLLLILQLTSCGGTFPMETVPKFFNVLYPFMPMTYSVKLFKETISGSLGSASASAALVLAAIGVGFIVLTILFTTGRRVKEERIAAREAAEPAE
jgi:putative membrane protein